jgi:hypothetical protein
MKAQSYLKFISYLILFLFNNGVNAEILDSCQKSKQKSIFEFFLPVAKKVATSNEQNPTYIDCSSHEECPDGTISFEQPDSEGIADMEGKCGQTAAANLYRTYCKLNASPKLLDKFFYDAGPGVAPKTLVSGLNNLWLADRIYRIKYKQKRTCPDGTWNKRIAKNEHDFLYFISRSLRKKYKNKSGNYTQPKRKRFFKNNSGETSPVSPLAVLIETDGKKGGFGLHWVTVVDMYYINNECRIIYNTWNRQYDSSCSSFSKKASKTTLGPLRPYTLIRLE